MGLKWKLRWSNDVNQDKNDFDGSNPTAEMPKISFSCGLDKRGGDSKESPPLFDRRPAPALGMGCAGNRNRLRAAQGNALRHAACLFTR